MNTLELESFVQLLSWICFVSVLLGHLVYDVLVYIAVRFIRIIVHRMRVAQCKTKL